MTQPPNRQQQLKNSEERYNKLKNDYEAVFSTPAGKRVLEDIQLSGYVKRTTLADSQSIFASNEGKRILALHIVDMATPVKEIVKQQAIKE